MYCKVTCSINDRDIVNNHKLCAERRCLKGAAP